MPKGNNEIAFSIILPKIIDETAAELFRGVAASSLNGKYQP
jgi:hypothetical protein